MSFLRRTVVCFEISSEDPNTLVKNTIHIKHTAQMTYVKSYKPVLYIVGLCPSVPHCKLYRQPWGARRCDQSFYKREKQKKNNTHRFPVLSTLT